MLRLLQPGYPVDYVQSKNLLGIEPRQALSKSRGGVKTAMKAQDQASNPPWECRRMFNPTYWTSAERFEFKSRSLQISFQLRAAKNARCFTIETQRGVAATKSGESRIQAEAQSTQRF